MSHQNIKKADRVNLRIRSLQNNIELAKKQGALITLSVKLTTEEAEIILRHLQISHELRGIQAAVIKAALRLYDEHRSKSITNL